MQREKKNHITFLNSVFIQSDIVQISSNSGGQFYQNHYSLCFHYAKHMNGGCGRAAPRPHYYEAFQPNTLL